MKNSLVVSSLIMFFLTFSYATKNDETEPAEGTAREDSLKIRVSVTEISLMDRDYDEQKKYDCEPPTAQVKLCRKQQSKAEHNSFNQ